MTHDDSIINVLHLEDSDLDAEFVKDRLERVGLPIAVERVSDRKSFVMKLKEKRYDLILSDYQVPTFEGLAALDLALEHQPDAPFIFVSGTMGEELAVETLKRGATDYVLKDRLTRLPAAVERALSEAEERDERRRVEERLQFALEAGRMGTWDLDLATGFLSCSDTCKAIYGRGPGDAFTYEDLAETVHEDDRTEWRRSVGEAIARGADLSVEYRIRWPDGATRWVHVRGSCSTDTGGNVTALSGVSFDLTDRKRAEEDRERLLKATEAARADSEAANRMKDEFLATLSHELRTPLNAILGWAKILRSQDVDQEDLNDGLAAIERNSSIQAQLIEDLLDISRIISGKLTIDVQRVNLVEVIEAAVSAVKPAADAKGIELEKALDALASPISGDASRLQQVVWNLLSNAVKFTPKGGRVQVLLERVESHVEIAITDTGQGIAHDFLPHVFERFRQADGSTTRRHRGLGLGLSIVRELVDIHGGSVRVSSPGEGLGSTFIVVLPIAATFPDLASTETVRQDGYRDGNSHCRDGNLAGIRVLVVDDEHDARQLLRRVLLGCQAEVALAGSPMEAIELVETFKPDVLVSDVGMPEQDGYDLIRQVRELRSGRELPAAALTAFARAEDRRRALLAGFQTHVAKPVDPARLIAVVATLVGRTDHTDEEDQGRTP
jgi:PAS domain S-box-containing protein